MFIHQKYSIVLLFTDAIVVISYIDVSKLEEVDGVAIFKIDIIKNVTNSKIISKRHCNIVLINLFLKVICWFYHIIYPGSSMQGITHIFCPFSLNYSGVLSDNSIRLFLCFLS